MVDHPAGFFQGTEMPTAGWWEALWPDPASVLAALGLRPGMDTTKRQVTLEEWQREQLRNVVPPLIEKWEQLMGVSVRAFFIQRMKTNWGSCNHRAGSIRLNTDLARKPRECLEYIVVHEIAHLIEPTHNGRFTALMDRFLPKWQSRRESLNRLPVRHESWDY